MSLKQWKANGWLKPHQTDAQELRKLLEIADRDLQDATSKDLSNDWEFGIAYNAALKLCTMMLFDAGYMPENSHARWRRNLVQYSYQPARFSLGGAKPWLLGRGFSTLGRWSVKGDFE